MKCLIVQPIHAAGLSLLQSAGIDPVLCPDADMASVAALIPGCDAVITRDAGLSAQVFDAADRLRVVVVHGTGHDAVDKAAAARRGVLVANTPGVNARSVAELAFGLAIAAARGVVAADWAARAGQAGFRDTGHFTELSAKTALIVGWGAIGRDLGAMLAAGLSMRVLVYSPRAPDSGGFERADRLVDGLAQADLVSLHTPLRPETRHMIGAAAFAAMRPGVILVNVARAGLVDEDALLAALRSGRVGAAALDVYSPGAPTGHLGALPNVTFTPHLGAATEEALRRVAEGAAAHVITTLTGTLPATALNPEVWQKPTD